ncbi:claudin-10-like isoform X2 [Denticeps clupeoides]|nr:claudin-10-like isoform X2 [Denticeps clupeoides]
MPTEYWSYSESFTVVVTTSNFYSNLWKDCISDSTGISDCKGFPSMLGLDGHVHLCRAFMIIAMILGFFGNILALIGMKCTKIGGSEIINARVTFAAGMTYMSSGLSALFALTWYGYKIVVNFFNPSYKPQKFEFGAALFVGWGGCTLLIIGGLIYSILAGKEGFQSSSNYDEGSPYFPYHLPLSDISASEKQPYVMSSTYSKKSKGSHRNSYSRDAYV